MTTRASDAIKQQHAFDGEMRVKIDKKIHPRINREVVEEMVQRHLEGEEIPGLQVEIFTVRGEDKLNLSNSGDYSFASGLISDVEKEESNKPARKGSTRRTARRKTSHS